MVHAEIERAPSSAGAISNQGTGKRKLAPLPVLAAAIGVLLGAGFVLWLILYLTSVNVGD